MFAKFIILILFSGIGGWYAWKTMFPENIKYKLLTMEPMSDKMDGLDHILVRVKEEGWFTKERQFISGENESEWFQFPNGLPCDERTTTSLRKMISSEGGAIGFFEKYPGFNSNLTND